jgi:hypothetical protein
LNNNRGNVLTSLDGLLSRLALAVTTQETTAEGITSTVGVYNLVLINRDDGVFGSASVGGNDSGVFTLSDDDQARAGVVDFGELGEVDGDFLDVGQTQVVRFREGKSFGFVTYSTKIMDRRLDKHFDRQAV